MRLFFWVDGQGKREVELAENFQVLIWVKDEKQRKEQNIGNERNSCREVVAFREQFEPPLRNIYMYYSL